MSQDILHEVTRPRPRLLEDENSSSCDFFSYSYLALAFFLFLCGSGLTFVVLKYDHNSLNPLSRFWMAGPFFICTGFLVALKVLMYVRRKRFIALLVREMTREPTWNQDTVHGQAIIIDRSSLSSIASLPPPYEATQPPSYDEAVKYK